MKFIKLINKFTRINFYNISDLNILNCCYVNKSKSLGSHKYQINLILTNSFF